MSLLIPYLIANEISVGVEIPGMKLKSNSIDFFMIGASAEGERPKFAPTCLAKIRSSIVKIVPMPTFIGICELTMLSTDFFAESVLKAISIFLIPESYKHFAKSIAFFWSCITKTGRILLSTSIGIYKVFYLCIVKFINISSESMCYCKRRCRK